MAKTISTEDGVFLPSKSKFAGKGKSMKMQEKPLSQSWGSCACEETEILMVRGGRETFIYYFFTYHIFVFPPIYILRRQSLVSFPLSL